MTYAPAYHQNRDQSSAVYSKSASSQSRIQEPPLPAPRAVSPGSYLTEKGYAPRDFSNYERHPHSPTSTASYSRNPSLAEHTPIQVPSPTYSQSSRVEQGYYGRDVNSRSGMMVNDYGQMSMQPAIVGSPDYIFTRHEDTESMDDRTPKHAVWLLVRLRKYCFFYLIADLHDLGLARLSASPLLLLLRDIQSSLLRRHPHVLATPTLWTDSVHTHKHGISPIAALANSAPSHLLAETQ